MFDLKNIRIDPTKLKLARGARGLTESARSVGISKQSLCNYESGRSEPPSSAIAKLCLLYQVPIDQLVSPEAQTVEEKYIAA